jgi:D-alanyl-lipoteichoic acid acyltransferase DltB (MBOAT superfamily)
LQCGFVGAASSSNTAVKFPTGKAHQQRLYFIHSTIGEIAIFTYNTLVNFTDPKFFFFLSIFLIVYRLRIFPKPLVILIGSYCFYAFWDWRLLTILVILSTFNFKAGKIIFRSKSNVADLTLKVSLVFNICTLGVFKYFNFFIVELDQLMKYFGFKVNLPSLSILVPLGISFYVFQISSYIIDIRRRKLEPNFDLVTFSAFSSYFPHMAAGPIMPASLLLPQIASGYRKITKDEILVGIALIINGLVRKIVIADTLAPMINRVYGSPASFDWRILTAAAIAFSLQIYGDFSGYSNMARGISKLMGIDLIINFQQPYFSRNLQQFWRRWHISLSNWFRDYLYVPLGGNRMGLSRTLLNLVFVMVVAGLWHGADRGFLVWGFLHGLGLAIFHLWRSLSPNLVKRFSPLKALFGFFLTQIYVLILWIPFRLPNLEMAIDFISRVLSKQSGSFEISDLLIVMQMALFTLAIDVFEKMWSKRDGKLRQTLLNSPLYFGILIGMPTIMVTIFYSSTIVPFIYFAF